MREIKPINYIPTGSRLSFVNQTVFGDWSKKIQHKALYRCECGIEKELFINSVKQGKTRSCGCLNLESLKKRATVHGYWSHPAYRIWHKVRQRCYNENCKEYHNYGGRGVEMCSEWKDNPKEFVEWALKNGWKKGLDIDKDILAEKLGAEPLLYSPERCLFVTRKVNLNHTRHNVKIEFEGLTKNLVQWAEEYGLKPNTLWGRLYKRNWPIDRALTEPLNKKN